MKKMAIGVDIGGSHITCQLVNLATPGVDGNSKVRLPVNGKASKETIIAGWVEAIRKTIGTTRLDSLAGIGFAMPGPFDYPNGVAWFKGVQKFENLYGVNVKAELINHLRLPESFPVRFLNDAACFAVGETWLGNAARYRRVIALTLGTGFGTTFIRDGLPVAGTDGIPTDGFLYHVPFRDSVADDYFSTRWFLKEYNLIPGQQVSGVKELAEKVKTDKNAANLFRDFGINLGTFLCDWIKKFDAECVVIGGNISKSYPLFREEMEFQFQKNGIGTVVRLSSLDEDAALMGSARLCDNRFYQKLIETKILS